MKKIKWNFTKFLVDKEGNVIKRYEPTIKPEEIEDDIVSLLYIVYMLNQVLLKVEYIF